MKQRVRRYFTQTEMTEVFDRWENGESLNSIARSLERGHSAVRVCTMSGFIEGEDRKLGIQIPAKSVSFCSEVHSS